MERLWAPWRMAYIEDDSPEEGCIFCRRMKADPSQMRRLHILDRGRHVLVMLNKYPYTSGHIMVVPASHVGRPYLLDRHEFTLLSEVVRLASRALEDAVSCEGINIGMNLGHTAGAGITDHVHYHLVPRWNGDTNFMPVIGDVRVMPEYLEASYDRLLPHFEGICEAAGDEPWIG